MNNQNIDNQIPPVEPKVQTTLGFNKGLIIGLSAGIVILLAAVIYLLTAKQAVSPVNDQNQEVKNEDETADWKIYANEKYQYQLKYPLNLTLDKYSSDENPVFRDSEGKNVFELYTFKSPEPRISIDALFIASHGFGKQITVAGEQAVRTDIDPDSMYKKVGESTGKNSVEFYHSGDAYVISIPGSYWPDLMDNLIQTFKFTNMNPQSQVSDWEIYKNEKYGFEVNYPNGWDIEVSAEGTGNPIVSGFYFGPIGGNGKVDGPAGPDTVVDNSKWGIQIFNKDNVTNTQGKRFEQNDKVYVVFNEGLKPDLFDKFVASFKFK